MARHIGEKPLHDVSKARTTPYEMYVVLHHDIRVQSQVALGAKEA